MAAVLAGMQQFLGRLFQEPTADDSDHLEEDRTSRFDRRTVAYLLLALALLSLIPRLLMIGILGSVCDDGYHYLTVAAALEEGNSGPLFEILNLNIYPPLLALFHQPGFDWLLTAKVWGAVIGGLAVLPLFGWVRRLFDDRVAVFSCLLYAVHPQLIELSVEPIRESTFWFLFMLSMYLVCRMLNEPAWWCAPAAGCAVGLAAFTRSEGFLLLLPLFAWSAWHLYKSDRGRWRIATRVGICLLMTPMLLVVTNVTLLRNHSQWEWGRLSHFAMGMHWLDENVLSRFADASTESTDAATPAMAGIGFSAPPKPPGLADLPALRTERLLSNRQYYDVTPRLREYVERLVDAFEPVGLLFLAAGAIFCWRQALHPDRAVLLLMAAAILGVVWIQFANYRIGGRYFLTAVLILLPVAGLGMRAVGVRLVKSSKPAFLARIPAPRMLSLLICLPVAIGWGDSLTSRHGGRDRDAEFAEGLQQEYGPFRAVLVNRGAERFGYHALGTVSTVKETGEPIEEMIQRLDPELIILSRNFEPLPERALTLKYFATIGWTEVNMSDDDAADDGMFFLRRTAPTQTAVRNREKSTH